MPNSKTLLLT